MADSQKTLQDDEPVWPEVLENASCSQARVDTARGDRRWPPERRGVVGSSHPNLHLSDCGFRRVALHTNPLSQPPDNERTGQGNPLAGGDCDAYRGPMSTAFHTEILPAPQKRLWERLGDTPEGFVLYGGTALALRLAHRESVDFDLFSRTAFSPDSLYRHIPYLQDPVATRMEKDTLECLLDLGGHVRVSFFGGLGLRSVLEPDRAAGPGIPVASALDIAATKALTVQQRAAAKDFIDIDAILKSGLSMDEMLGAAQAVHGPAFNPVLTMKALSFYGDGDLHLVPESVRKDLAEAIRKVDLGSLPGFRARETLCEGIEGEAFGHGF